VFELSVPDSNGITKLQHFQHAAKSMGVDVETLTGELNPPQELEWVWSVFLELDAARSSGGMSISSISFSDIYAWCQLTDTCLERWELNTIKGLDSARLKAANGRSSRTNT